jgi:hypothetical protein
MPFTQIIELDRVENPDALRDHLAGWDADQAGEAPGYRGARLLADREAAGRYLVEVDFESVEAAERNDRRQETTAWAAKLRELVGEDPSYRNLEPVYETGR